MAMKKPMKRAKRYDDGGFVDEATAKQRGLDMSNKEEPVGFFERMRMGNIDQPGTEAYNRFGAGRTYAKNMDDENEAMRSAMRAPSAPAAPSRPLSDDMYSDTGSSTGRGSAGTSETITPTRQVMVKPTIPASKPVTKPTPESMPVPSLIDRSKPVGTGNQRGPTAEELADYNAKKNAKPTMNVQEMNQKAKDALKEDPTSLLGAGAAAAAGLYGASKLGKLFKAAKKAANKSPYIKEIGMEPKKLTGAGRMDRESQKADTAYDKLKNSKFTKKGDDDVTDVTAKKRGGKVMKYASGGMVGSASRRADGIASKGKTRCKIC